MTGKGLYPEDWTLSASCAGSDPDLWFPIREEAAAAELPGGDVPADDGYDGEDEGTEIGTVSDVKRICRRCPVQLPCLNGAVARRERHGIWGGMTFRERERFRQKEIKKAG